MDFFIDISSTAFPRLSLFFFQKRVEKFHVFKSIFPIRFSEIFHDVERPSSFASESLGMIVDATNVLPASILAIDSDSSC